MTPTYPAAPSVSYTSYRAPYRDEELVPIGAIRSGERWRIASQYSDDDVIYTSHKVEHRLNGATGNQEVRYHHTNTNDKTLRISSWWPEHDHKVMRIIEGVLPEQPLEDLFQAAVTEMELK